MDVTALPPFWRIGKKSIVEAISNEARKRGMRVHAVGQNQLVIQNWRCQVLPGKLIRGNRSVRLYPPFGPPTDILIYLARSETSANARTIFVLPAEKPFKNGVWSIDSRILQPFKNGWDLLRGPTGKKACGGIHNGGKHASCVL